MAQRSHILLTNARLNTEHSRIRLTNAWLNVLTFCSPMRGSTLTHSAHQRAAQRSHILLTDTRLNALTSSSLLLHLARCSLIWLTAVTFGSLCSRVRLTARASQLDTFSHLTDDNNRNSVNLYVVLSVANSNRDSASERDLIVLLQDERVKKWEIDAKEHHAERKKLRRSAGTIGVKSEASARFRGGNRRH